jgi:hypothetical protein
MPLTVFRVTAVLAVRSDRVGPGLLMLAYQKSSPPPRPNALASQTFTTKGTRPSDKVA